MNFADLLLVPSVGIIDIEVLSSCSRGKASEEFYFVSKRSFANSFFYSRKVRIKAHFFWLFSFSQCYFFIHHYKLVDW